MKGRWKQWTKILSRLTVIQTPLTKILKDKDKTDNFWRASSWLCAFLSARRGNDGVLQRKGNDKKYILCWNWPWGCALYDRRNFLWRIWNTFDLQRPRNSGEIKLKSETDVFSGTENTRKYICFSFVSGGHGTPCSSSYFVRRMNKPSPNKAFSLIGGHATAYKGALRARFVYSIKHKNLVFVCF